MEDKKIRFLDNLKAAGGIIYVACENTGINRSTYYKWRKEDPEFATAADEVQEAQIDFVESKLMGLINAGDTTATIFYLKTKGKKRGYSEKFPAQSVPAEPVPSVPELPAPDDAPSKEGKVVLKRIKNKKSYIVKLLKQQGKYTAELSMQVNIAAQLLVRTDMLADEIFNEGHRAVNVEISREGNERESISPKEKLYLDLVQQSQRALRALGMNTDAKERKTDNDGFSEFMKEFKEGEE